MAEYRNRETSRQKKKTDTLEWTLLLVGRTAMGKSSTGNTILSKNSFQVRSIHQLSDLTIKQDIVTNEQGELVRVIDASGICDSAEDRAVARNNDRFTIEGDLETLKYFWKQVENLLCTIVTLVLFVFKFGSGRFTSQEKNAVRQVKTLFGEEVFKKFGVVVVSGGDIFEKNDDGSGFDQWIRAQTGDFGDLVKECKGRCVLLNNVTVDEEKRRQQITQFWKCAEEIRQKSNGKSLTWTDEGMKKLIWSHDIDKLNEQIDSFHQRLAEIEKDHISKVNNKLAKVKSVQREFARFKENDKGYDIAFTSKLNLLQGRISRLLELYQNEVKRRKRIIIISVSALVIGSAVVGVLCGLLT